MELLLALAAFGVGGYFLTRDYKETEPVEIRQGRKLPGGGRLLGVSEDTIFVLEGVKKRSKSARKRSSFKDRRRS